LRRRNRENNGNQAQSDEANAEEDEHSRQFLQRMQVKTDVQIPSADPGKKPLGHDPHGIDVNQNNDQQGSAECHGTRGIQAIAPAPLIVCIPDPDQLDHGNDEGGNAFDRQDDFGPVGGNGIERNHQHGNGKRKGRIDENFDAGHFQPTHAKAVLNRAVIDKFLFERRHESQPSDKRRSMVPDKEIAVAEKGANTLLDVSGPF
jgi:hypothetical protein